MAMLQLLGRGLERIYMNEAAKDGSSHAATSMFDIDAPAKARTTASARHLSAQLGTRMRGNTFEVTVARDGDLMGECFFHVTLDSPPPDDPFELIEHVEYVIGGSVIESYTGKTLAAVATFDRRARPSVVGNVVVLPLRLCTSAACSTWLPLISLRFHEVVLRVTTPARLLSSVVVSRALHVEYACLDTEERRKLAQTEHELIVNPKMSAEFTLDMGEDIENIENIDVDLTPWLAGVVLRDLIVEICPQPGTTGQISVSEIVLRSERGELMRLDAAMAARVLPRSRYGIDAFDEGRFVYYLPFDNAPADPFATATLRVRKEEGFLRLQVSFAERRQAGECRVHVTARTFNAIKTCSGMAALAMFVPPTDLTSVELFVAKAPESDLGASFFSASFGKPAVWIPAFLSDEECDALRLRVLERNSTRKPGEGCCWLQEDDETLARLQLALERVGRKKPALTVVPNSRVTYGVYAGGGAGLARHADEPLQGGAMSLLVYLNDVPEGAGGATKFYRSASVAKPWKECRPVRGAAVLFDVGASHEAEPVAEGHFKVVVSCELIRGKYT